MTWEQKLAALNALGSTRLVMRRPGEWCVTPYTETRRRGRETNEEINGKGRTPEEAVEDHWNRVTDPDVEIISNATHLQGPSRTRWDGWTWCTTPDPSGKEARR